MVVEPAWKERCILLTGLMNQEMSKAAMAQPRLVFSRPRDEVLRARVNDAEERDIVKRVSGVYCGPGSGPESRS